MKTTTTGPRPPLTREQAAFRADVIDGLSRSPRTLPCKYFYDARGSHLFDRICELEEYYPTRTELALMDAHAGEMAQLLGPRCLLIEPGSGSGVKTRRLLDRLEDPVAYVPVDVSAGHLFQSALRLRADYPALEVWPLNADFTAPLRLSRTRRAARRRAVYFPGSTIGNFDREDAVQLLARLGHLCGAGGALLIGVDLKKDRATLEAAYNDRLGVTRQFNLNLLERINRDLGESIPVEAFEHRAPYNAELGCIEMFLVARRATLVEVDGESFAFGKGEAIRTERSYKYTAEEFGALAAEAGWRPRRVWVDGRRLFSVHYLENERPTSV